jgi:hypothetical protein
MAMKLKRAMVGVGLALACLAVAAWLIQGAKGRGVAVNENGLRANFQFDVKKGTNGNRTDIGGPLEFRAADPATKRAVELVMPRARRFAKSGNVAEFGGPARGVFMEGRGRIVREGTLQVRVEDRKLPRGDGEPDLFGLRFEAARGGFVFEFRGAVRDGDLVVYERTE